MSGHLEAAAGDLRDVPYEPTPHGLAAARDAVADYYADRGAELPISQLFLAASTSEAYGWLVKILADPGEAILVPSPSYPLFEHLLSLEAIEARPYSFRFDGSWHLDAGRLRRQLERDDRTAAIVAVSPNNPTGHLLSDRDLDRLERLADRHDVPLVVDEVFLDFQVETGAEPRTVLARGGEASAPLRFALGGLSKAAGLPGAKLGWIAVDGPGDRVAAAADRLAFVADTYLSASTITQLATPAILEEIAPFHREVRERLSANLERLDEAIASEAALTRYPVEAGWYAVVRTPGHIDEAEFVPDLLRERDVLVQPGFYYDLRPEGHLVVSLLTDPDVFSKGCGRMIGALSERV